MNIEESALLNNALFDDVLKPIVEVSRYTIGNLALVNPEELNQQINFFTTSGFASTLDPKTKNVAFTFSCFNVSNILGVTEDGPSSNVNAKSFFPSNLLKSLFEGLVT